MNRNGFGLTKNLTAAGPIPPQRVVVFGAVEGQVEKAVSATAKPFAGVTGVLGAVAVGERIDIHLDGVRPVEAGGVFSQGADLTVDAEGRVIAAAPGAGVTMRVIGQALGNATAIGEIVQVHIVKGALKG